MLRQITSTQLLKMTFTRSATIIVAVITYYKKHSTNLDFTTYRYLLFDLLTQGYTTKNELSHRQNSMSKLSKSTVNYSLGNWSFRNM